MMYRVATKQAANGRLRVGNRRPKQRRRLRKPYRQGDLDGLCGVYSAVNAVRFLCPEVDGTTASWLFEALMQALPKVEADPATTVTSGVGRRQLAHLLKRAIGHVGDEMDIRLTATRLPDRLRQTRSLDELWVWLGRRVSPKCVAVLGLGGRYSHWTVTVEVTPSQIRLFDSGTMGVLRRRSCTVGKAVKRTAISPVHVFLIARKEG